MKKNFIKGIVATLSLSLCLSVFGQTINVRADEKVITTNDTNKVISLSENKQGLVKEDKYFYFYENGQKVNGWKKIESSLHYFDTNYGYMYAGGVFAVDGCKYYFDEDGEMQTGWIHYEDNYYYFGDSGVMQTGWKKIDGIWYCFDKTYGTMIRNTTKYLEGCWYYFNENGEMATGPVYHDGAYYLYGDNGARITDKNTWSKFNNKWYRIDKDGEVITKNIVSINNAYYAFNKRGEMVTSQWYQTVDNRWHYIDANGVAHIGWLKLNGVWYYFSSNGAEMYCDGAYNINGKIEHFDKDGHWLGTW